MLYARVKHVYGYEVVAQAISDARRNAELNGIDNATFVQGDLNKIDENFGKNFPRPDVVISGRVSGALNCTGDVEAFVNIIPLGMDWLHFKYLPMSLQRYHTITPKGACV